MTFDQLALRAPRGQNTILLQGDYSLSECVCVAVSEAVSGAGPRRAREAVNTSEELLVFLKAMLSKPHPKSQFTLSHFVCLCYSQAVCAKQGEEV